MSKALFMAAAAGGSVPPTYVDDVFSTYLYQGTGTVLTFTNGIDLAGQGGLVWTKDRNNSTDHKLVDTQNGGTKYRSSNSSAADVTFTPSVLGTTFTSSGFTTGGAEAGADYASWTFRKAPKFFDVVTWTGNATNRDIAHSLGVAPGCIMVKRTDTAGDWQVYHRSLANTEYLVLNSTAAKATGATRWNSTTAGVSTFRIGTDASVNANGGTYVAYLFAHDTATKGFIQCGSFTTDGSGVASVTLGWEPQWLIQRSVGASNWDILDSMRGLAVSGGNVFLRAESSAAEGAGGSGPVVPNATGFTTAGLGSFATHVYIAIRRPNKPPTVGAEVFAPVARTGTGASGASTSFGQVTDLVFTKQRSSTEQWAWTDRLRGPTLEVRSSTGGGEVGYANDVTGFDTMAGFRFGTGASGQINTNTTTYIDSLFRRAPGFFDVVCYTGNGATLSVSHNLGVAPELILVKRRDNSASWGVLFAPTPTYLVLELSIAASAASLQFYFGNGSVYVAPTSSAFTVGNSDVATNASGGTYVSYLFATLAGISKVGSYTGNGSSQTINCGFSTGARFVLIKRTDSTGDWYVWDSARGIVSGNDPHLSLNANAAEVTTDDTIDPATSGFIVNQVAATNVNVNAATYIYLAIA